MRLPPTVHGDGDHGFMATLVGIARDKGVSGYIGDGSNRWPAVHRLDAAHLFRLALEKAPAGSVLHAVADEGVPIRAIAEVIGRHLDVPVAAIAPEDAAEHFAWLAGFLGVDSPASSALTRELLGWQPTQPGLLDDLDKGHYFRQPVRMTGRPVSNPAQEPDLSGPEPGRAGESGPARRGRGVRRMLAVWAAITSPVRSMGECERVTGALEHIGDRVRHLVYLDAFVPGDGDRAGATAGGGPAPARSRSAATG